MFIRHSSLCRRNFMCCRPRNAVVQKQLLANRHLSSGNQKSGSYRSPLEVILTKHGNVEARVGECTILFFWQVVCNTSTASSVACSMISWHAFDYQISLRHWSPMAPVRDTQWRIEFSSDFEHVQKYSVIKSNDLTFAKRTKGKQTVSCTRKSTLAEVNAIAKHATKITWQ